MNPLEERSRFPFEDRDPYESPPKRRPTFENPEVPAPERVDPVTPAPAEEEELPEPQWEGQEGIGPGQRDAVKREEKGEPSPEVVPPSSRPEEPHP
ncbi:MAG TPA: hypothetical protein VNM14_17970 [Planctomycetota bacterium]|jgi:hypothetical protein|nr:hypothetical protein [Planctomycetota bacterium]